jgi:hypothetical protein
MWLVLGSRGACRRGNRRKRYHLEDMDVDVNIMLIYFKEIGLEDVNWFAVAQDREKWQGIVNTVMNLPLP